jgi:spore coat-associated protein N
MTDEKSTLTRRRVLGGMATIGAAGALGAGTWAQMQDTETRQYTVQAGVLDLQISGPDNPVVIGPLSANDPFDEELTFEAYTNEGNVPGDWFGFQITNLTDGENGVTEPEDDLGDTGGAGELAENLTVDTDIYFRDNRSLEETNVYTGKLSSLAGSTNYVELPKPLGSDDILIINVRFKADQEDISEAMSDIVEFDYNFTLYDEDPR